MAKGKVKVDGDEKERTISWADDQNKFMLDWCIEYMQEQHAGFRFKKHHLMKCADALNRKFAMGVTLSQVDRHFRHYKENWKYIAAAISKSGNVFDAIRCVVTISESEKSCLNDRARRLLSKPIKFYYEMQELFTGTSADGSLAMDQHTCTIDSDDLDSDEGLYDLNIYPQYEGPLEEDSDTLPTTYVPKRPPIPVGGDNSSSSTSRVGTKRPRGSRSPTKKPSKTKSRFVESAEEINSTLRSLQQSLIAAAPPQMPQVVDPYASLWQRLEVLPITTDQRITVGVHLSSKDNEGLRSGLCSASDKTFETWVSKFFNKDDI
ncbi:uncharacterized protein LOC123405167 [Hordeum vulgare subsp. vulgare]|uniref:Myb/SANT-like domain-containing protein n=1 Tax=Hordeum vulgare subsp. vulgare TaxID=112509 RepID=A0A8I6XZR2_HORVV|nr:uncharacterized protein LOC123405167 [Hordeum vulgare subsp. vulgare]